MYIQSNNVSTNPEQCQLNTAERMRHNNVQFTSLFWVASLRYVCSQLLFKLIEVPTTCLLRVFVNFPKF
jgi:hypothetical protein